ncbi:MAG: phosphoglycerate mutase family protein, partial [Bacteroidota bacterium]
KICVFFLIALSVCTTGFSQPTVYIVRHAEKLANWPEQEHGPFQPLSEEGVATARRLAQHFGTIPFAAIYSSPTTRSLHTGFPLSQQLNLPLLATDALRDTALIDSFYTELSQHFNVGQAVLLVTHSNIIPYLLIKAGLSRDCYDKMGIQSSMVSRWLVIEGYENIYRVESLGAKRATIGCEGITREKF